eukprot:9856801-Heterocapsa_arctica.AAC.1
MLNYKHVWSGNTKVLKHIAKYNKEGDADRASDNIDSVQMGEGEKGNQTMAFVEKGRNSIGYVANYDNPMCS